MKAKLIAFSAAVAIGWTMGASAAPIIVDIGVSGAGLGSFSIDDIDNNNRKLVLEKTFDRVEPIRLTFTVVHSTGDDKPFVVSEAITNSTGGPWHDFHFDIVQPANADHDVVFARHNKATLSGFKLDKGGGDQHLNFTGMLANGGTSNAAFNLSLFDPKEGTYQFDLVQTPSAPEPGTWAILVAGFGTIVALLRRRIAQK